MPQSLDRKQIYAATTPVVKTAAIQKEANFGVGSGFGISGGSVVRANPKPYSPIYDESYLMMPRDRRELNQWCRHFYATDPIVRNAIDLHTRYPLSKFDIKCPYPKVRNFFEDMCDYINLHDVILGVGQEYWKIGEVFPEAELDETKGMWTHIHVHNPDYIDVRETLLVKEPLITLIPDDELRRIIRSPQPADMPIREQISSKVIQYVMTGQNIPLNNFFVSFIANKASPYDKRGTSILECIFKDLMLRDKYREAQYVIADDHVTPLKVYKIGNDQIRPTDTDLQAFRDTLGQAMYDPNFSIIYHHGLTIEYVGSNGVVLDLSAEYERIERLMFIGLFTSQAIAGGEGPTFSGAEVALDVLQQRYLGFRQKIERWIERKIFKPISEINEFYEYDSDTGEKKLIVPKVSWHKINLKTNGDYLDKLIALADTKKVSYSTLFGFLDLDFDEELNKIPGEQKHFKKVEDDIANMASPSAATPNVELPELGNMETTPEEAPPDLGEMPPAEEPPKEAV